MHHLEFPVSPAHYGLPTREQIREWRVWDGHYHGFNITEDEAKHRQMLLFAERMGIERLIALDIGGPREAPFSDTPFALRKVAIVEAEKDRVSGICRVNPADPDGSCRQMEKLIRNGPCIGIKYGGPVHNPEGILCSHPNNDPIIRLAQELGAVVYIHTWMKVGGTPRMPGLGNDNAEPTPRDVVILARRFPNQSFICGHSGGDWELGVREIRAQKNVFLEFLRLGSAFRPGRIRGEGAWSRPHHLGRPRPQPFLLHRARQGARRGLVERRPHEDSRPELPEARRRNLPPEGNELGDLV